MSSERYNGWSNYETWVVNLWMDNEEGSHDYWLRMARYIYENEAEECKYSSKMDDAISLLADHIKDHYADAKDTILEEMKLTASVWADLLGAALSETNWREIAEHLLENVEVEA